MDKRGYVRIDRMKIQGHSASARRRVQREVS